MHTRILLSALLASVAIPAFAADMPVKAPYREPAPVDTWTGFYFGIHGGYGWGHDKFNSRQDFERNNDNLLGIVDINSKGGVVGGHFGYQQQWGNWVGGLEVDVSATGIKGSKARHATETFQIVPGLAVRDTADRSLDDKFTMLGSARGRLGFLIGPNFLLYGTGGLGWTQFKQGSSSHIRSELIIQGQVVDFVDQRSTDSETSWRFGAVVGAGGEFRLSSWGFNNTFLGVEWLHYDFGKSGPESSFTVAQPGSTQTFTGDTHGRLSTDVVRGRLTYKFGSPY